jgi:C4-dicarboxylate-specific signal transduction histidine kinase
MESLRFSTTILRLLGEELIPSPDQGILELIKNAYDADATQCDVELRSVHVKGGSIVLRDNGIGMGPDEIRNGWLVVGDSLKAKSNRSPSGRFLVGSKGLGRLGALRLGQTATLITRPKSEPGYQYSVTLDWRDFDRASVVEDVELNIEREIASNTEHGTDITISDLPSAWKKPDIKRLARSILLLRDPFAKDSTFRTTLKADEFRELQALAKKDYRTECDYHLVATVDEEGRSNAKVLSAGGKIIFKGNHSDIRRGDSNSVYRCPEATFELWEFLLSGKDRPFSNKRTNTGVLKAWLQEFGGVRLYHKGVRISPYGEAKNDWLDMNLRRAQNPEQRPSTNNSLGRVQVIDPKNNLQQKTDRIGFVESEAFDELREFIKDVIEWMARERITERNRRLKSEKEKVETDKPVIEERLNKAIESLPEPQRKEVASAVKELREVHKVEVDLKDEVAHLYFTLGTVGTTAAAFAHQTKVPIRGILYDAKQLLAYLGDPQEFGLFREDSSRIAKRIKREADAIYAFSNVTLKLLEHEKRRSTNYAVNDLINETKELLEPYFNARETDVTFTNDETNPKVWCARAAFEAVLTNLLTNSLQAFERAEGMKTLKGPRQIQISTRTTGNTVIIQLMDNGPGITEISLDDIWRPGKTMTEHGTGLGLAIVRDVVEDMRGWIEAEAIGELGGATFTITLPIQR